MFGNYRNKLGVFYNIIKNIIYDKLLVEKILFFHLFIIFDFWKNNAAGISVV